MELCSIHLNHGDEGKCPVCVALRSGKPDNIYLSHHVNEYRDLLGSALAENTNLATLLSDALMLLERVSKAGDDLKDVVEDARYKRLIAWKNNGGQKRSGEL